MLHGETLGTQHLSLVDSESGSVRRSVELDDDFTALATSGDDGAVLLRRPIDGDPDLVVWRDDGTLATISTLPHPGFSNLTGWNEGLIALEVSGPGVPDSPGSDQRRIVKIEVVDGVGRVEPLTDWDPARFTMAMSSDGWIAAGMWNEREDVSWLEVGRLGEEPEHRLDTGPPAKDLSIAEGGQTVWFRAAAGLSEWDVETDVVSTAATGQIYLSAVGPSGRIAAAFFDDGGPIPEVCILGGPG